RVQHSQPAGPAGPLPRPRRLDVGRCTSDKPVTTAKGKQRVRQHVKYLRRPSDSPVCRRAL
ncbi:hypothetical protein H4R23_004815, partial [Coemansia sp. Cherry 401B]